MNITPQTNIRLLKAPIKLDNKNQITFENAQAQYNYFSSLEYIDVDRAMYQRKDGVINYPAHYDTLVNYDYCMYQNDNYSDKWFYAFITGMEYINDNMTRIKIDTDVFQTWQFDLEYKASYIEREMINVSDDIPGANLYPESLETGEYKVQGMGDVNDLNPVYVWAYSSDKINLLGTNYDVIEEHTSTSDIVNGIPTSVNYIVATNNSAYADVINSMSLSTGGNQSEYIVAHFTIPSLAVAVNENLNDFTNVEGKRHITGLYSIQGKANAKIKNFNQTPTSIDGYTPRNQKLRTYPYLYLGFNPPNGSSKVFRYEDFSNGIPSFKMISEVNPNPTIYFIPQNYRGASGDSHSDSVTLGGYPQLSSKVDIYNSWVAQNAGIINLQTQQTEQYAQLDTITGTVGLLSGVGGLIGGGSTVDKQGKTNASLGMLSGVAEAGVGLAKTGLNWDYYVKNLSAQVEKQKMLPDNVSMGSSNATLLGYEFMDNNIFTRYGIKRQFAERIDKYWDMYGYPTNELKIPNINNRPNWNYIKTAGINLLGDIPQDDLLIIEDLFNNGITLWHNPATFLDYAQNNR